MIHILFRKTPSSGVMTSGWSIDGGWEETMSLELSLVEFVLTTQTREVIFEFVFLPNTP